MGGIEKGYCGNKKSGDYVKTGHQVQSFTQEKNWHHISYQKNGRAEVFSAGWDADPVKAHQRWFRVGEPLTDVANQREIVEELMGEMVGLPEEKE